ncbi:MAG: hypothetical protein CTY38_00730 [Methylotenera sp.]|uniref:hypothetical protein n=1 Tax=Methylotenera sp. TaxID=2051956 RepID=UPI000D4B72EA|nr:hypothetical protein [Methylotenera sp.]PPC84603.1 MAG: hypothetical protein CTY38_00730 [Methylotenera sp.]
MKPNPYLQHLLDLTKEHHVIMMRRNLGESTLHEALQMLNSLDRETALASVLCPHYNSLTLDANLIAVSNSHGERGPSLLRTCICAIIKNYAGILSLMRFMENPHFNILDINSGNDFRLLSLIAIHINPPKYLNPAYDALLDYVINRTSDINSLDGAGWPSWTLPHYVVKRRNLTFTKLLMEHGADFGCKTNDGLTCEVIAHNDSMEPDDNGFYAEFLALKRIYLDHTETLPARQTRRAL